jgi:geranylgeranylglycerol-phosphate geranylgeranyltransferase
VLILRAILRLTRIDSNLLAFLAVFLPSYVRTHQLTTSLQRGAPIFFICACTFISNDLEDIEKDSINHPDRPLPSRHLTPVCAVVLYFICLAGALLTTRQFVTEEISFWYYALISLSISYGYIVDYLPSMKAFYVAIASSFPVLILSAWHPLERRFYGLAVVVFLLTTGREMCMNIEDTPGDNPSFLHRFDPMYLAAIGFALQISGFAILLTQIDGAGDVASLALMGALLALSAIYWFNLYRYKAAIALMKVEFFVGLYFLL